MEHAPLHRAGEPADPNYHAGTDSERIAAAARAAFAAGLPLRIPARKPDAESPRRHWLIDSAILLPKEATLILDNCRIKLSDRCRDNFIRSANCAPGAGTVPPLENIHILGIGSAVLEGADRPRSTGDSAKTLGERTFGADAGKPGEAQRGDWRNIGILLANVRGFSIRNLVIRNSHMWAVSLEYCTGGSVRELCFHSRGRMTVDGAEQITLNQDGLDLRRGCRDIVIDTITGETGDDLVALTAIGSAETHPCGELGRSEFCPPRMDGLAEEVSGIVIRNVAGHSAGGHHIVRFLNTGGIRMRNILLDGLVDTSPDGFRDHAAVKIGDCNPAWGGVTPLGDTAAFQIVNVQSRAKRAVLIAGSLADSQISNILNSNPETAAVTFDSGPENTRNLDLR